MIAARRQAYLEALEIPVWVRKGMASQEPDFAPALLTLGPGAGEVLMICAGVDQPSNHLATDIARSLKYEPVWAWLSADDGGAALSDAVREKLFTTAIVFGSDVAAALFREPAPQTIHSARLLIVPSLQELAAVPAQRRVLWKSLCDCQLAGTRQGSGAS